MDINDSTAGPWQAGDLQLDAGLQRVLQAGVQVELPKLSFDLLQALMRAAPHFLTNEELMTKVWRGLVVSPETVTQRVKLLRDALGDDPKQPRYIEGRRSRGYRLIHQVTLARQPDVTASARRGWWLGAAVALPIVLLAMVLLLHPHEMGHPGSANRMAGLDPDTPLGARSTIDEAQLAYNKGRAALGRTTIVGSEAAEQFFQTARNLDPNFVPAIVGIYSARMQAASLRRLGDASMALARKANESLLTEAQAVEPGSPAALLARATWGDVSPAQRALMFETGLREDPENVPAMTAYSELLDSQVGRRDDADQWLQRALASDPTWPRARFRAAQRQFLSVGSSVEQQTRKLLDVDSDYYPSLQRRAKQLWQHHGDVVAAISVIEQAIAADRANPLGLNAAVAFYLDVEDPRAAEELTRASPVVRASTSVIRAQYSGDWRTAGEAAMQDSSYVFNEFERWGVDCALRDYALETGQYDRIMGMLSRLNDLPLDDGWKLTVGNFRQAELLAHLLLATGQQMEAMRRLDEVIGWIDANPHMGPVYNLRYKAQALQLKGQTQAALGLLKESFEQNDYTQWWYTLRLDPVWMPLHEDARFIEIVDLVRAHVEEQKSRLAELRRVGRVPDRAAPDPVAMVRPHP
jgi:DNA-binding winged helix-turn-helix (wHTH) protein